MFEALERTSSRSGSSSSAGGALVWLCICGAGMAGLFIAAEGFGVVDEGFWFALGAFDGALDEEF